MYKASLRSRLQANTLNAQQPRKDSVWNILSLEKVFGVFNRIVELSSSEKIICILQKCRKEKNLFYAKHLHAHICNNGLEAHRVFGNYIVPMFVECGSVLDAQHVFNRLVHRNEHSWTSLMSGYIQCGQPHHALDLYEKMQEDSVCPSSYTIMVLLKACAKLKDAQRGREIHAEITDKGFERDPFVGNALVDMYGKCGLLPEARGAFDNLPVQDVVSWNALITGYAEHGLYQEVLKCFELMQLKGISPSIVTFLCVLRACGSIKAIDKGRQIHEKITQKGFGTDLFVGNTLVDMYAKCGSLSEAHTVFDNLPVRNVVSWNALIVGYAQHGCGEEAMKCFEQMQLDGFSPDSVTLVCILKACGSIGAIDKVREIHKEITQEGFGSDLFVGNTLVDVYAKCGSFLEAQEVFDKLPVRDVVSWSALIAGYTECGHGQDAIECFEQMQLEVISPDAVTFICTLKACGSTRAIDKGREIHRMIMQKGFEMDQFVGNALVDMYAKCGSLSEAREVFDKLPVQDVVSWNALIAGYADIGPGEEALKCFEQMQLEGISPDSITYVCILKACGSIGAIVKGREIHMKVTQEGMERDVFVGNTLVDMYAKCGSLLEAREVFDKLPVRDVVLWTALIAGYAEHGPGQEALKCFEQMQLEGIYPDAITFLCILKACGTIGAIDKGRDIHTEVTQKRLETDLFVGNTLVDMYAKCGSLSEAQEVFDKLPVQDVVSWNTLIAGYAEHGPGQQALKCFEQMQVEGICPDNLTYVSILKVCGSLGAIMKGREIHREIAQKGFESDLPIGNTLVDMYAKFGSFSEAWTVFDKLPVRDVVSWTALIAGYAEHGPSQEALKCFEQMHLEGVSPNAVTLMCCLKACGNVGAIDKGREIHAEIARKGFESERYVGGSLVDMYAKCGSLLEARWVFDKLPVLDVVSWSAMINAYGMNHEGNMAIQCFEDMQEQGVKPNGVTFTCLLTACSRMGLVFKGQEYFKVMRVEYGIVPSMDHYTCMVDLLARSGHLYEAEKFLESMPCFPSIETWTALLSACKTYGEAQLGLKCFQQLVQMNPEGPVPYVLMAGIYANAGRRHDAYRIEEMRKLAGAKKKPASALIEVNNKVHEFLVGDKQTKEISAMLEILSSYMKEEGHVPNLDLVLRPVSDDEKEVTLCEHAEKLAVAFGLLNTPQGQTLHVTKNMRMCDNCHNANKALSLIERREIIVRDSYCVHHFKNGLCSCTAVF